MYRVLHHYRKDKHDPSFTHTMAGPGNFIEQPRLRLYKNRRIAGRYWRSSL